VKTRVNALEPETTAPPLAVATRLRNGGTGPVGGAASWDTRLIVLWARPVCVAVRVAARFCS